MKRFMLLLDLKRRCLVRLTAIVMASSRASDVRAPWERRISFNLTNITQWAINQASREAKILQKTQQIQLKLL